MPSYLVTGGAGFIGSNLCHALAARGDRVRAVDNLVTGKEENLAGLDGVEFLFGDICDPGVAARAMRGVDYVLHQAAIPSVPRSVEDPMGTSRNNVMGTISCLEAARKEGVKRLVLASSSSIYGEVEPGLAKTETMLPAPLSPYAAAKIACEYYLRVFFTTYGFECVALRYFNVFGPRQDPTSRYSAVVPNFIAAALDGQTATIYGDGHQSRDFCYVGNVVEANLLACTAPGAAGKVMNVACGESTSLLQMAAEIGRIVGRPLALAHAPERLGEVKHSLADVSLARRILGRVGEVKFAAGIEETIAWYRRARTDQARRA